MPLHKDIELLQEPFKQQVKAFLTRLDQLGIKYLISETLRDKSVQECYFAQGRKPLDEVNKLRKATKLWDITEAENKNKITWTLNSKHCEGLAIDICPAKGGEFWWSAPIEKWKEIADVAESLGIESGFYWRQNRDSPHFQQADK